MPALNTLLRVTALGDDAFRVNLVAPAQSSVGRGGAVQCGYDGCEQRYFIGRNSRTRVMELPSSTCVSERQWTVRDARGNLIPTDRSPFQFLGRKRSCRCFTICHALGALPRKSA